MYCIIIFWSYCVSIRSARLRIIARLKRRWGGGHNTGIAHSDIAVIAYLVTTCDCSRSADVGSKDKRNTGLVRFGGTWCGSTVVVFEFFDFRGCRPPRNLVRLTVLPIIYPYFIRWMLRWVKGFFLLHYCHCNIIRRTALPTQNSCTLSSDHERAIE